MIRMLIFLCVLLFFSGCSKPNGEPFYFNRKFSGLWAETEWNYQFYSDGTFEMKCKGHYDFNAYPGSYFVLDSVIYLTPDSDWQILDGVIKTRLKLTASDCVRDNENNFYCISYDNLNNHIEEEYLWQEKVISVIDSFPEVIREKRRITRLDKDDYGTADIRYQGIITVNKNELHHFRLERESEGRSQGFLDFLVERNSFKIYLHHSVRDSLSLIYDRG